MRVASVFVIPAVLAMSMTVPAAAQVPAVGRSVAGVVFDSIANTPLRGAVVEVASIDSRIVPFRDTTGATGRFRVNGLAPGRYLIAFQHHALDAYGIVIHARTFDVTAGADQSIDLAIPPGRIVHALRCASDSATDESGMLAGVLRDAVAAQPVVNASMVASWSAIVYSRADLRTEMQRAVARVSDDGSYVLCGLPLMASVNVSIRAPGYHAIDFTAVVPESEVARADAHFVDSSITRGPHALTGSVIDRDGKPVASGRAVIDALALDVPISQGRFGFSELPPGTWKMDLRAIGFDAKSLLVDVADSTDALQTFVVDRHSQQLDVVNVVGSTSRTTTILQDVLRRHRASPGTVFMPGNPSLEAAARSSDVLRAARGFSPYFGKCKFKDIATYLNGDLWPAGFESLDRFIAIGDVLAIEAFPTRLNLPVEYQQNRGCAVVVVWTRQR